MDGAIVLDKPPGMTSHDAVLAVRRLLSEPRIGHLGTLDPFATGVLVLLAGAATRLARFYKDREKTYEGAIRLGYSTDSYDCTGEPTSAMQVPLVEGAEMDRLFKEFLGARLQQPPAFSAKKISGVPACRLARKGRKISLAPVPVVVHEFELQSVEGSLVKFRTRVSSGTYIRSLAHELGQRMGVGAHLAELRRTAVGEFNQNSSTDLQHLEEKVREGETPLIPMEDLLPEFPAFTLSPPTAKLVCHGNNVEIGSDSRWVRLIHESGKILAIGERLTGHLFHPVAVFPFKTRNNS